MEIEEYIALITSEHQDKTKFIAMTATDVAVPVRVQKMLEEMIPAFDVDLAIGAQLDVIGTWVGATRAVTIPITGVYFSWDSAYDLGWEYGTWQPSNLPTSITELPDDAYRTVIRGKISANQWNGTTEGAYNIWDAIFPQIQILIQDNQNMSYDLALVGGIVDSLTLALLTDGYIPLKPEGVRVNLYLIPVNDGPLFGWDLDSDYVTGWDSGSWAREVSA